VAKPAQVQRTPRRRIIGVTAAVAIVGLVATLAVVADGYDAQQTPRLSTSVWVIRDDGQYARVNTDLGEIDTVRTVDDPSSVIQNGSQAFVLTQDDRLLWPVDPANPVDLSANSAAVEDDDSAPLASLNTPPGTREIATAGVYVAYLTDLNKVFLGQLPGEGATADVDPTVTRPVDPFAGLFDADDPAAPIYEASAVAVSPSGLLVMYSADEQAVRSFDATRGEFIGDPIAVSSPPEASAAAELSLALIGDRWVLSDPTSSRVWLEGDEPFDTGLSASALLQTSTADGDEAYLADQSSLVALDLSSGSVREVAGGSGEPARPVVVDGVVYAAWLNTEAGTLWSSDTDQSVDLDIPSGQLDEVRTIVPVIHSNGTRAVLGEKSSGLLWTVPDGALIPLDQWTIDDAELEAGEIQVDDVATQEPPVAVADELGVRAGALVRLPLLLNDHDPNKSDVLSIAPESLTALSDPAFGDLGLISNNQEAVIRVHAGAGSATFSYAVTDGLATSAPVLVTLTVIPDDVNSAPVWCGVTDCVQEWPTPQVAPGGTITIPVLTGWVDPEGDPIVLTDARKDEASDPVTVVPKSDGSIAIRHQDQNAAGGTIPITVSISDSRGANATKTLELVVTASPSLSVAPVAIVAGVGEKSTMTIADHVFGGSGTYRLLDAATLDDALLVVSNSAAGTIEMTAESAGEYALTYTVQDVKTSAEQSAVVRVSVMGVAPLAIAPLTTFVRANEDSTVDVLGAVQNTSGRVLLVSSAITTDPALSVSVVGQSSVRVSGSTADGLPGVIGTAVITVTDGAGAFVEGTLTVFLAPASTGVGAIAVPDAVTVRAGGQIDIPVTANDVSPRGERLQVLPQVQTSGAQGELAFVNGDLVRYLAPTAEGEYVVTYSVFLGNEPNRPDSTTITITVIAAGSNRAPQPPILKARVLGGQTVQIPVQSYGMDPDGDAVALTSVTQPKAGQGVASISADGTAIVYTAPGSGISGAQVSFGYSVRDAQGATADGAVRVGVLDADITDSAPVTYSDYIRAQKDAAAPVTVLPLLNDSDPADGELTLVSIKPNTPAVDTNPEYARLLALIDDGTSLKDGTVMLNAGDVLGTHSYIYTVKSSKTSSTSEGLIVVSVADEGAVDHPEITDTVITAKNRNQLADGIDVVSGKVEWRTGDVGSLTLKLWGGASGYEASGTSISGPLPQGGALIPFVLSGRDSAGTEVTSYGFLRIPAFDDMRLQLSPNLAPVEVGEEKSVTFDVLEAIDVAAGDDVSIRDVDSFVVQRANSSCVPSGSTDATYKAGREAPWTDYCAVPVRLKGQSTWTILAVPISIQPKDPLAQLSAVTRTISPGASDTVDMEADMTSWQGGRVGDKSLLDYAILYSGSSFVVTREGSSVHVDTRADARPGTRETISVSVSSFGGLSSAITLVVGIATPDTPRGATFTQQCDVRDGASCSVTVIGHAGEYDPFAGKVGSGLTIDSIGTAGVVSCPVASVSISGTSRIIATYPAGPKPAGGECIVNYTVKDAQGRIGAGQLTLDVLGYPARPASLTTAAYTASSVTLNVALGEAALAHPSVTGVVILENGSPVPAACSLVNSANYQCVISGLSNGEHHTYSARAENSVGQSLDTTSLTSNAYSPPVISTFTVASVYEAGQTTTANARLALSITSDSDTLSFKVTTNTTQTIARTGSVTLVTIDAPVGTTSVTVVPVSQYSPPLGTSNEGSARTASPSPTGSAIGQPYFSSAPTVTAVDKTTLQVSGATLNANFAASSTRSYLAWRASSPAGSCTADANGDLVMSGADVQSTSATFTVPESFVGYTVMVCGTNSFGVATSTQVAAFAGVLPAAPGAASYRVRQNPSETVSGTFVYDLESGPTVADAPEDFQIEFLTPGPSGSTFAISDASNPSPVGVRYCATSAPTFCTTTTTVTAQTARTTATVVFPTSSAGCIDPSAYSAASLVSSGMQSQASLYVQYGTLLNHYGQVKLHISWSGDSLNAVESEWLDPC
jgi:large repetitive protein